MNVSDRIEAFARLGNYLKEGLSPDCNNNEIKKVIAEAGEINPWFTRQNLFYALREIARLLEPARLEQWLAASCEICLDRP